MDAFDLALAESSEQGSQMWIDIRAGRFTASGFHNLTAPGYRDMTEAELAARPKSGPGSRVKFIEDETILADSAEKYIRQKVAEVLTGIAPIDTYSHAKAWGEENEPIAAEYFANLTGIELIKTAFIPYGDNAGCSPDRLIGNVSGLEIKCPFNSENQIKYLELTDQWDLKRFFPEYYWQIACCMRWTDRKHWNFVAFDPRMKQDKHKIKHIEINYGESLAKDFTIIDVKLDKAVKKMNEIIATL